MASYVESDVTLEPADWQWLKRQCSRRGLKEMDVINELMQCALPNGFVTSRPMTEEEMGQHLNGIVVQLVRKARLNEM